MKNIKIYIASPYTNGWMPENVRRQIDIANHLMNMGYYPYVPLLTHFLEIYSHRNEEDWLDLDIVFMKTCDAVLRIKPLDKDGNEIKSPGADLEEKTADKVGIPVFYNIEELHLHFRSNTENYNKL